MPELRRPGARPKQLKRMATERINEVFQPWAKRPGEGSAGQGGRTQEEWVANNRMIADKLDSFQSEDDMFSYLVNEQGFDRNEAAGVARQAYNNRGPLRQLRTEQWGVPNASADELLNMAALIESGFTDVQHGAFKGTDIAAVSPSGRPVLLDAQMRTGVNDNWSIPVLGNAFTAGEAFRDPRFANATLGDFIDEMVQENGSAWADKLLHDPALHREFFGRGISDDKVKDALISTRRSRRSYDERRDNKYGARRNGRINRQHGPFDPQPGDRMDIVDLQALRTELLNQTIAGLREQGITNMGGMNQGGFRLSVPNSVMQKLTNNVGELDPEVVRALSIPAPRVIR